MKQFILATFLLACFTMSKAQFEAPKLSGNDFEKVTVKVGGDFALQLQGINHNLASSSSDTLLDLKHNVNLPTANLNITATLAPGIQVFINNYMSSRHHNEAWVEGGYLTIDRLPFLPASDKIMEKITLRAGVMMPNYGDAHFYRSTNADVINNPFVGNWIMDAFTTNPEIDNLYRNNGIIALVGFNNGRLNFGRGNDYLEDLVFNWKIGYDKELSTDLRVRATLSGYHVPEGHSGSYLWGGDRAGARYYNVMQMYDADDNFRSGRWDPSSGQSQMSSYMANVFVKFKGLEIFGIYETMKGVRRGSDQNFTQMALQAIYNISDFYLGARINKVDNNSGSDVNRINIGGGWYMTENVLVKLDYVNQKYNGSAHGKIDGGQFKGLVMEAAISF